LTSSSVEEEERDIDDKFAAKLSFSYIHVRQVLIIDDAQEEA
jgi:hypothetical protein